MFGLTVAHTAVALAVVTLGYDMGLLSTNILNATVLVILITCGVAPIITASAASKVKIKMMEESDDAGSSARTRVNNTLIPIANAVTGQALVDLALLMRNQRGHHNFYALHVRNDKSESAKAMSRNSLESARKAAAAADVEMNVLDRYDLNTVTGVLNAIQERDITEVILGMHRRMTVIDSFFGNKVEQLLKSTNKMLIITRCFIPANTITRIVVWVPEGAQYETGFSRWIRAVARLTRQVGCRVIFCCPAATQPYIRGVLYQENFGIRCEFRTVEAWDDFILLANKIQDDDLFVVISARPTSISYTTDMTRMPDFLQKYFSRNNLMVIYPEQFGEQPALTSFVDPMAADISTSGASWVIRLRAFGRSLRQWRRKLGARKNNVKIDL